MEKTLLSREDLAQRWGVNVRTIIKYEQDGIITRNPNLPTPRYSIFEINKLDGIELNRLSPIERKRLEKELEEVTRERDQLKSIITEMNMVMTKAMYKQAKAI